MQRPVHMTQPAAWAAVVGAVVAAVAGGFWMGTSDGAGETDADLRATARPASPSGASNVDERRPEPAQQPRANRPGADDRDRLEYDPAVLRIVTNFKKADASVNGIPYPEYTEPGDEPGMVLPAGGPYTVRVTYNGNEKVYTIGLDPYEVRYLIVELSGYEGGAPGGPDPSASEDSAKANPSGGDEDGTGRVTVYSKPKGTIQVDGSNEGQQTPGTIEVSPGEHDVQVKFKEGKMSESKTVRVRKGSRIKLFFRKND